MHYIKKEKQFPSSSGLGAIRCRLWIPDEVHAAIQLTHGMAEHIDRYDEFACYLADHGFLVFGQDHIGHGKSTVSSPRGYFGESDGWTHLLEDMKSLFDSVKPRYPAVPFILFGHSMGSFLARSYAVRYPGEHDAYIFCGTAGKNSAIGIAKLLAKLEIKRRGASVPSLLLNGLAFGAYNKRFEKRTAFDWLTRDPKVVDAYIEDPNCGFVFSAGGMADLFHGLSEISSPTWFSALPDRPYMLIAGAEDPVGDRSKGVLWVADRMKNAHRRVECKLYEGARHELLQETNKYEVFGDIALFAEVVETEGDVKNEHQHLSE